MKTLYVISLLTILTLPAFAAAENNPFTNASTIEQAWEIFETQSQSILDEYKDKLKNKEYNKLQEMRNKMLAEHSITNTQQNQKGKTPQTLDEAQNQQISELRENADAMRNKEQSTANKLIGAAGIGATGIGGMQLASALSEQSADNNAEQAMTAYLATFTCEYGDNRVSGGKTSVDLPGGNELIDLYSEYVALANDLKTRKNALGVKPGIESETILDSATSGLYDDVGTGITSGTYASLSRALSNPDGKDAKMWAAQREETAKKLKTGAITAGVGAAGSLLANLSINAKGPQENSDKINAKYAKLKQAFQEVQTEIDNLPSPQCPDDATGTHPNCNCKKQNHQYTDGACVPCESNQELVNDVCIQKKCNLANNSLLNPSDCSCINHATKSSNGTQCICPLKRFYDDTTCKCDDDVATYDANSNDCKCKLTGLIDDKTCKCIENARPVASECKCRLGYQLQNGKCEKTSITPLTVDTTPLDTTLIKSKVYNPPPPEEEEEEAVEEIATISISSDAFFDSNQSTITDPNKEKLIASIWEKIAEQYPNATSSLFSDICLTFTGHADWTGKTDFNNKLSKERAQTVARVLIGTSNGKLPESGYRIISKGESECTPTDKYSTPAERAKCRRVDISIKSGKCDA